ncbi:hypothetical protein FCM35_KLT16210 [Carex littledalei]|uniref:KIB1-4 beta-propeller domain-containing protein n=1 Tax=Carex littledalei TaxID=544730 RepID=A0A833W1V7_9POAL|nr:hypothetical protein FCM35_KLT16210 [Carex littledalei]
MAFLDFPLSFSSSPSMDVQSPCYYFGCESRILLACYSGEFHTIHVPNASDKFLAGPSHGYLLAFDTRRLTLSLLNPFTCNEIPLPPLQLKWSALYSYFRPELICAGEVVAISGFTSQGILLLASCRSGDSKWVTVELQVHTKVMGRSYYKGMYFVNESEMGKTTAIDARTGGFLFSVPTPDRRFVNPKGSWMELLGYEYLVVSNGELACNSFSGLEGLQYFGERLL